MMKLLLPARLLATQSVTAAPYCSWCEAGDDQCDMDAQVEIKPFVLSISPEIGDRTYPIWQSPTQPALQEGDSTKTVGVIVHHGAGRNGNDYASYMLGAVKASNQTQDIAVFSAQVYELGDEGMDPSKYIYWDPASTDSNNWKWGGEYYLDFHGT
jgi:hypothetical protein